MHVPSLKYYKLNRLEFLEFQSKSKILWAYFIIRITPCQKWKSKIINYFFKFALLIFGDIQLNPGQLLMYVLFGKGH